MSNLNDIGLIGVGVMGAALAMNIASKGFKCSIYNRTYEKTVRTVELAKNQDLTLYGYETIEDFVKSLKTPRLIIVIVTSGAATNAIVDKLVNILQKNDVIIDAANEYYLETEKRLEHVHSYGIHYLGMGVSGGEYGARFGPSLMPGGDFEAYVNLEPILQKIAAQSSSGPCVKYIGARGAGHYIKMVHNGIEYSIMEGIAEIYDICRKTLKLNNASISTMFTEFSKSRLNGYLCEITALVLKTRYPNEEKKNLVDNIYDVAGAKGTGKWTSQESFNIGIPAPNICAAVDMRNISTLKELREQNEELYSSVLFKRNEAGINIDTSDLEKALYLMYVISFITGLMIIERASFEQQYNVDLANVLSVWENGCILRCGLLVKLQSVINKSNMFSAKLVREAITECIDSLRAVVICAFKCGVAVPALSATLNLILAISSNKSPMNLIQALRDHFGAHTFMLDSDRRTIRHADWENHLWLDV